MAIFYPGYFANYNWRNTMDNLVTQIKLRYSADCCHGYAICLSSPMAPAREIFSL